MGCTSSRDIGPSSPVHVTPPQDAGPSTSHRSPRPPNATSNIPPGLSNRTDAIPRPRFINDTLYLNSAKDIENNKDFEPVLVILRNFKNDQDIRDRKKTFIGMLYVLFEKINAIPSAGNYFNEVFALYDNNHHNISAEDRIKILKAAIPAHIYSNGENKKSASKIQIPKILDHTLKLGEEYIKQKEEIFIVLEENISNLADGEAFFAIERLASAASTVLEAERKNAMIQRLTSLATQYVPQNNLASINFIINSQLKIDFSSFEPERPYDTEW